MSQKACDGPLEALSNEHLTMVVIICTTERSR